MIELRQFNIQMYRLMVASRPVTELLNIDYDYDSVHDGKPYKPSENLMLTSVILIDLLMMVTMK